MYNLCGFFTSAAAGSSVLIRTNPVVDQQDVLVCVSTCVFLFGFVVLRLTTHSSKDLALFICAISQSKLIDNQSSGGLLCEINILHAQKTSHCGFCEAVIT